MHIIGGCDNLPDYVCSHDTVCSVTPPMALVNCDTTLKFTKMSLLYSLMLLMDCFGPRPIAVGVQVGGLQLLPAATNLVALTRNLQGIKHRHADHK